MPRYYLVPEARKDLTEILEYIAGDSIDAALRVHDRLIEIFELLAENPDAGHFRDDLTTRPVRFFPVWLGLAAGSPTRACSRRSRLSRSVFARGPRRPSSLLKPGVRGATR